MTKKVFFDTDCISSFFRIGQRNIIEDLFNARIVFPEEGQSDRKEHRHRNYRG